MVILTLTDDQADTVSNALELVATNHLYTMDYCEKVDSVKSNIDAQMTIDKLSLLGTPR